MPEPGERGSSWVVVALDTTAPVITWGTPSGGNTNEELVLPYTLNEPGIFSADLIDLNGRYWPLTVTPSAFRIFIPADFPVGQATVSVNVADAVGNTATRILRIAVGTGEVVTDIENVGGGHAFVYGPITIGQPVEDEFPGSVTLLREKTIATLPLELRVVRPVGFDFPGNRQPSARLAQIREEDELLLLLS